MKKLLVLLIMTYSHCGYGMCSDVGSLQRVIGQKVHKQDKRIMIPVHDDSLEENEIVVFSKEKTLMEKKRLIYGWVTFIVPRKEANSPMIAIISNVRKSTRHGLPYDLAQTCIYRLPSSPKVNSLRVEGHEESDIEV